MTWSRMEVYLILAVTALISQASAIDCDGPVLASPLLRPVQTARVVPNLSLLSSSICMSPQIPQIPTVVPDIPVLPIGPCLPVTNPTPVISTTVVDNSLANSLANTLQLLIVSELIESSLTPAPKFTNIFPLYDAIGTIGTVVSPFDVIAPVDIINYSPAVEVSTVVTDMIAPSPISPILTSVVDIVEVQAPIATYAPIVTEVLSPVTAPAPISEVITQSTVTNIYGSNYDGQVPLVTEVSSFIPPVPIVDTYTTITDINSIPVTPISSPLVNAYYGFTEYAPAPTYVTEVTQISSPLAPISYLSDYYSGYADVITPVPTTVPFAAELILPQSIPAQIVCNFGSAPMNIPVFSMNVEPLPPVGGYVF